jgi:serine/threonine protein kinase
VVKDKKTEEIFACKVISKAKISSDSSMLESLRREISVMQQVKHSNIIKYHECFEDKSNLFIIMERCTGGELFDRIQQLRHYQEVDAARIMRQVVSAVAHLHSKKIAHCDLKPDNLLFLDEKADSPIKVIDFGMSKFRKRREFHAKLCGTHYYIAPEVLDGKYNEACDMWSLGVILFIIVYGYAPFNENQPGYPESYSSKDKTFAEIRKGFTPEIKRTFGANFPPTKYVKLSEACMDLIASLLKSDPAQRLTAEECLNHPWISRDPEGLAKFESASPAASAVPTHSSSNGSSTHSSRDSTASNSNEGPVCFIDPLVLKALHRFRQKSKVKVAVINLMATLCLTKHELRQIRDTFQAFDSNKDGIVSAEELLNAIKELRGHDVGDDVEQSTSSIVAGDKDDSKINNKEFPSGIRSIPESKEACNQHTNDSSKKSTSSLSVQIQPATQVNLIKSPRGSLVLSPAYLSRQGSDSLSKAVNNWTGWIQRVTLKDVADIIKQMDLDNDGGIQLKELEMAYTSMKLLAKEERMYSAFKALDRDNNGTVSLEELTAAMQNAKILNVAHTDIKEAFSSIDVDGNGVIDYDEFIKAMESDLVEDDAF